MEKRWAVHHAARSNCCCYAELSFLECSFLSCILGGCRSDRLPGSERERASTLVFSCVGGQYWEDTCESAFQKVTSLAERIGQPGMSPCSAASQGLKGSEYGCKSKGGLALCWIPNSVLAIYCKYVLGVRSRQECFSMLIYVCKFYVCNAGCTNW